MEPLDPQVTLFSSEFRDLLKTPPLGGQCWAERDTAAYLIRLSATWIHQRNGQKVYLTEVIDETHIEITSFPRKMLEERYANFEESARRLIVCQECEGYAKNLDQVAYICDHHMLKERHTTIRKLMENV